jgi:hypothetical protein
MPMRPGSTTDDYRKATWGEGDDSVFSLVYDWKDKPHRLVYDLCDEVNLLRAKLAEMAAAAKRCPGFTTGEYSAHCDRCQKPHWEHG